MLLDIIKKKWIFFLGWWALHHHHRVPKITYSTVTLLYFCVSKIDLQLLPPSSFSLSLSFIELISHLEDSNLVTPCY